MKIALLPFAGEISNGALLRLINIFGEERSQRVRVWYGQEHSRYDEAREVYIGDFLFLLFAVRRGWGYVLVDVGRKKEVGLRNAARGR